MDLNNNVRKASKWSLFTEILTKLMSPVVNMVLARLISPEAFGMVATITMVTSFADIFTDAGFQKYIIQKQVDTETDLDRKTNVAFWTNLMLSIMLWGIITYFRHDIAYLVGNEGLGNAIAIAALSLPLTSFSSIQMARYKRSFDFKTLFFAKLLGIFIPLLVTIPLAFLLRTFWAIVIGNIAVNLSNAILLTARSKWKPNLYYSFSLLKEMISFSLWTLFEQLLGWANLNIGIFIVGRYLSEYYLGLYKTSMATTNQVMLIFVNAFSPVLLSALSRLKDDKNEFNEMYYSIVRRTAFVILPLGIGVFVYRNLFTTILLGNKWMEASTFIGLWGMLRALNIVYGFYSMEVFVSLGKPKYAVMTQLLEFAVLMPALYLTVDRGYTAVYLTRCAVVIWSILVETMSLQIVAKISFLKTFKYTAICLLCSILMGAIGEVLINLNSNIIWNVATVFICIIAYFILMGISPSTRKTELEMLKMIKKS